MKQNGSLLNDVSTRSYMVLVGIALSFCDNSL